MASFPYDLMKFSPDQADWIRSKKICEKCLLIFKYLPARGKSSSERGKPYHHSFLGLEVSAVSGCPICELFVPGIESSHVDRNEESYFMVRSMDQNESGHEIYDVELYSSLSNQPMSTVLLTLNGDSPQLLVSYACQLTANR